MTKSFSTRGTCRFRSLFMIVLVAVASSGCAHSYVHNAERDKQGQEAVKATSELKLAETVSAIDKKFEGLLGLELDAAKTRFTNIREHEIRQLTFSDKPLIDVWKSRIVNRLTQVGGSANWDNLSSLLEDVGTKQKQLAESQNTFADAVNMTAPSCDDLLKEQKLPESAVKEIPEDKVSEAHHFTKLKKHQ